MMNDNKPKITADVQRLIDMEDEMILARDIAPIIHVKPDVIIKYVKTGQWDADRIGNFVISGDHVKFFRKDFLVKCGFMEPEKKESRTDQLILKQLIDLNEGMTMICQMLTLMMEPYQLDVLQELIDKKTAGAATPTD